MLRVGLTGGMASGKSTVAVMFAERGAHVIQADTIAHELMRPGGEVYDAVLAAFGREILASDGSIDRSELAAAAFPDRAEELNRLTHPAVIRAQERWMDEIGAREPNAVAIVEAALIYEAGIGKRFHKIIVVTSELAQKAERLASRSGMSLEIATAEVERRMRVQMPEEEKARLADYVINNSGTIGATETQVDRVWKELKSLAAGR